MLGHLEVAKELYTEGAKTASYPHFGHPYHEVYPGIAPALESRGIDAFDTELEAFSGKVQQGGDWSEVEQDYASLRETILSAMADVDDGLEQDAGFQAKVQLALLKTALHEYEEAVDDGEFKNVVEYQDGRGFVLTARESLERHADMFRQAGAYDALVEGYDGLLEAWPTAKAPESPVMTVGELSAAMFPLEAELGKF
ncbi:MULTISPECIES: hypothetical protein [unclassified Halomonas]|uniref:Uncharacterized protein n=3 Tax=Halomonas TaxID=2745 RepID=A0ABX5IY17_9GAMM|nr:MULTISPECIES: hypothetical protein [unclassified Halomonas]MCO7217780.1 hypothetical protein [Halomonas sp. OfavH-34-E]PTL92456.1 hypothetical protein C6W88_17020 [Halomonas litopenaei]